MPQNWYELIYLLAKLIIPGAVFLATLAVLGITATTFDHTEWEASGGVFASVTAALGAAQKYGIVDIRFPWLKKEG